MSVDFPVALRLNGLGVVVIGGGYGTERRVRDLLAAGARVRVISDVPSAELETLAAAEKIRMHTRPYRDGDLAGAILVVACPSNRRINAAIWREAQLRGLFMNAIDDPAHGNFTFPAIHRQGDLTVSVSTAGKSPCLAVALRDRIGAQIGQEYGGFLDLLGEIRAQVVAGFASFATRLPVWRRLIASDAIDLVRAGNVDAARARLQSELADAIRMQTPSVEPPTAAHNHPSLRTS